MVEALWRFSTSRGVVFGCLDLHGLAVNGFRLCSKGVACGGRKSMSKVAQAWCQARTVLSASWGSYRWFVDFVQFSWRGDLAELWDFGLWQMGEVGFQFTAKMVSLGRMWCCGLAQLAVGWLGDRQNYHVLGVELFVLELLFGSYVLCTSSLCSSFFSFLFFVIHGFCRRN